jgi:hypothetical protein
MAEEKELDTKEQMGHCANIVQAWIDYSVKTPELMLGTQLRAFGVSAGLAMRICSLEESEVDDAVEQMSKLIREIYKNSEDTLNVGAVH